MTTRNNNITEVSQDVYSTNDSECNETQTQNSSFSANIYTIPVKDVTQINGKKVLYSTENSGTDVQLMNAQLNFALNPGRRIMIIEEDCIKTSSSLENFTSSGKCDNIESDESIEFETNKKLKQFLRIASIRMQKDTRKIGLLEKEIITKDINVKEMQQSLNNVNNKLENEIDKRKVVVRMFRYGFIPYLIYLLISFAIMVSSFTLYILWRINGVTSFNPAALFMVFVISLGWTATAITGLISVKNRSKAYEN